ncbi:MAG: DUF748 domain-containing protein [Xanthomonadales bacterium]|jgi:hypothetical protein|nr:DUF748 domain-containing protein [Xanthomonadales bacterium]
MPDISQTPEKPETGQSSRWSPWLDYRRKRFWAVVSVLLYTVIGFFLVPALVSHLVVKNIKDSMDREAVIGPVRFNPYVLSLQVEGFELKDRDDEALFSFDDLFVNFQLSSLFRWAWTFREFSLDGAPFFLERFTPEDNRLSRLLADIERLNPEPAQQESSGELPRLLIGLISIRNGSLLFRDHVPGVTVDVPAGPVTVDIKELNTLPDRSGQQSVEVRLAKGALLSWQGSLKLQPLESSGRFTLQDSHLDPIVHYLKSAFPLDSLGARLSARTDYRLEQTEDGSISVVLENMQSQLMEVTVSGLTPASEFLSFSALETTGGTFRYPENTLHFERILLQEPYLDAWLGEDGQPGLMQLLGESSDSGPGNASTPAWHIAVDTFELQSGRVQLADRSIEPAVSESIEGLNLKLEGIDNSDHTAMPFELELQLAAGGSMGFNGELVALPALSANGEARIAGIPLAPAQPYIQQQLAVAVESGTFGTEADFSLTADGHVSLSGALGISALEVTDAIENEPLLAWETMEIDRYEIDSAEARAKISSLRFRQPYGRIEIREDLSTNVGDLLLETAGEDAAAASTEVPGWSAVIGGILIEDGSMDFSDLSLPLHFATRVTKLDGTVSTIDSASSEPANIRLEGQVDEYGLARIEGGMNLLDPVAHTDVTVEFRNLLMTSLSPYSVQFAGREIDEGKLNLDLEYRIDGGQLDGQNSVVLSDLVLGREVESADAVSLPLGLAVALLKDDNGVIDIDLPVTGDINDPEFKIGGVIWKAFAGLITKVVTAPFKLLGGLIGVDSEDFGQFEFLAGRHDLTPPELEMVAQLKQALEKRPELRVEINGVFDQAIDTAALQYLQLRETAWQRLGRDPSEERNDSEMLNEEIRKLLEVLYAERFPASPLDELKAMHSSPPADEPEGKPVLDELAYAGELRDRLVASEPVGTEELTALANMRAQAIYDAFLASGDLDPGRVQLGEPEEVESEDGEWVVMELGVATD